MAKIRKRWWIGPVIFAFIIYVFITARPIQRESILRSRWISSLETGIPVYMGENEANFTGELIPFLIGSRFGYIQDNGVFALNRVINDYIAYSERYWTEYQAIPSSMQIMNTQSVSQFTLSDSQGSEGFSSGSSSGITRGYPLFLDDNIYILGMEQNSISSLGTRGEHNWTFDFSAPLTCIDAASNHVLAGTLDGTVILLDPNGRQVFTPFEPGGSDYAIILGCAISQDANMIAVVSGINNQRFLLLERSGDIYITIYHEFIGSGFRRPVHINFVDNDRKVAFEWEDGIGIFDINTRTNTKLSLNGEIVMMDNSGDDRFLFIITQGLTASQKRLVAIRYPAFIIMDIPFKSENVFMFRRGSRLYIGGDNSIAAFEIDLR